MNNTIQLFGLTSAFGGIVGFDEQTHTTINSQTLKAEYYAVLAPFKFFPHQAFLLYPQDNCRFDFVSSDNNTKAIAVQLIQNPHGVAIQRSGWSLFLRAHPNEHVDFEAQDMNEWEWFSTFPTANNIPAYLEALLNIKELDHKTIYSWIKLFSPSMVKDYIEASIRILSNEEYINFCSVLKKDIDFLHDLRVCFPEDPWFTDGIPALLNWKSDRTPTRLKRLTAADDKLATTDLGESQPGPLGFDIAAEFRRDIAPRKNICIVATARNEALLTIDWIGWHLSMGVDHFFLYTNDNNDGSDALLEALSRHDFITWIDSNPTGCIPQRKSYAHALSILPDTLDYKWSIVIDLDELVILNHNKFSNLRDFLQLHEYSGQKAVALNWVMMAPSGVNYERKHVWEKNLRREPAGNRCIKSIFQTRYFSFAHAHTALWPKAHDITYANADGQPIAMERNGATCALTFNENNAWIGHYFYRSFQEFCMKNARGRNSTFRADKSFKFRPSFFTDWLRYKNDEETLSETRALLCLNKASDEAKRIRDLPGVREAETAAISSFFEAYKSIIETAIPLISKEEIFNDEEKDYFVNIINASLQNNL
ncbi:glycosyltransferase family 2 protein [Brytella acorum]|uniref:Glycosyltransferase family 2 protein n=1 Tax=Brytella acorum TaxID=2959299 RepID=A0AA35XXW0_9PROT|nr:glycosyltransferase family 2 protein [Brytella acorum]MDF3623835.1 glycosyltransferase family 2 protein [Brytella acorum]CAI9120751.1 glycosyltransferase family 2 protein [Brytella acorum]